MVTGYTNRERAKPTGKQRNESQEQKNYKHTKKEGRFRKINILKSCTNNAWSSPTMPSCNAGIWKWHRKLITQIWIFSERYIKPKTDAALLCRYTLRRQYNSYVRRNSSYLPCTRYAMVGVVVHAVRSTMPQGFHGRWRRRNFFYRDHIMVSSTLYNNNGYYNIICRSSAPRLQQTACGRGHSKSIARLLVKTVLLPAPQLIFFSIDRLLSQRARLSL